MVSQQRQALRPISNIFVFKFKSVPFKDCVVLFYEAKLPKKGVQKRHLKAMKARCVTLLHSS